MGLKPLHNTIVVEALEVKYIRYSFVSIPTKRTKLSRSLLNLLGRRSSKLSDMPKDSKLIEIMANKKGNGQSTRYHDVRMREDSNVDRCLISEKLAKDLLQDGKPEVIPLQSVCLSDGKTYPCSAKFDARYCNKDDIQTEAITLYVTQGIKDEAIFPKDPTPQTRSNTIAPIERRPRTSEQKKEDEKREKEAKRVTNVVVQETRDKKKAALINSAKKSTGAAATEGGAKH